MKSEEMLAVKIIEIDRQQPAETKALLNQRSRAKLQQSKMYNLLTYNILSQKPKTAGNEDTPHPSEELLKQNHPCILWRGFLRVEKQGCVLHGFRSRLQHHLVTWVLKTCPISDKGSSQTDNLNRRSTFFPLKTYSISS